MRRVALTATSLALSCWNTSIEVINRRQYLNLPLVHFNA